MAETQRSIATMQTLLADNTGNDISAQDVRDLMETLHPGHGTIYVTSDAATTPDNTSDYKDIAGTFTLEAHAYNWDMNTNGQLRYTGAADRIVTVAANMSMLSASNNQVVHFRVAKNGTSIASSEIQRKIGTGSDIGAASCHTDVEMSTNDYITLQVRNETSTGTVTVEHSTISTTDWLK